MSRQQCFNPDQVPPAFGQANTGAICYFNSLLQALATCTHFIDTVLSNTEYMARTRTGHALFNFLYAVRLSANSIRKGEGALPLSDRYSDSILRSLVQALKERQPNVHFGTGMEGASEAVTLLLDMIEPPSAVAAPVDERQLAYSDAVAHAGQNDNPIAPAFRMRVTIQVWCEACHKAGRRGRDVPDTCKPGVVSFRRDTQYIYHLFSDMTGISTPAAFAKRLISHSSVVEDYKCEECTAAGATSGRIFRLYKVTRAPPIIQVVLPQYHRKQVHYFPTRFRLEGKDGKWLEYELVAQVEHSGSMTGGHYWTRALRCSQTPPDLVPATLNDRSVGASGPLGPTSAAYILFFHLVREIEP